MSTDYANGDVPTISYTPGGNPIKDIAGNNAAALVAHAVTNNVNLARVSASITIINQILKTAVVPSNLAFGSGGIDTPFSISFWMKRNNTATDYLFELASQSNPSCPGFGGYLDSSGVLDWFFYSTGGVIHISANNSISANIWTHVVVTYDGSSLVGGMKMYFNGTLQAVTSLGYGSYGGQATLLSDTVLAIFGRAYGSLTTGVYNTKLVSWYYWNKELTTGDISNIYNGGALVDPTTLSIATNLKAQYEFNNNTLDSSSDSYNLSSITAPTYTIDTP
jgi:hypothetical protein